MHINFKYFIVSISAIFLALGIGIFIGSNLGSNENIQKQNEAIIKDIDNQISLQKERNDSISAENESYKQSFENIKAYMEQNETILNAGRLKDKKFALISFNVKESSDNIQKAISEAGGELAINVKIEDKILDKKTLKNVNDKLSLNLKNKDELIELIYKDIKDTAKSDELKKLEELGIIKVEKSSVAFNVINEVIIFTNSNENVKNKFDDLEKPFISQIRDEKKVSVVQTTSSNIDNIQKFTKMKLPTISNVDEASGRISLVQVLLNEDESGAFGNVNKDTIFMPKVK